MQAGQGHQEGQSWRQSVAVTSLAGWNQTDCLPSLGLGENGSGKLTEEDTAFPMAPGGCGAIRLEREEGPRGSGPVFQPADHKLVYLREGPAVQAEQNSFGLMVRAHGTLRKHKTLLCDLHGADPFQPHHNLGGRDPDCRPPCGQAQRHGKVPLFLSRWGDGSGNSVLAAQAGEPELGLQNLKARCACL